MSKRSKTLQYITQMALNYTHYHMTAESISVNDDSVEQEIFLKHKYEMSEQIEGQDQIIHIHLSNVNITAPIEIKNNIDFGLNVIYVLKDSTVTEVNVEILDIDFLDDDDIKVFIKDFINNYLKYIFTGIVQIYLEYDEVSVDDGDETVKLDGEIQINLILDKKNNIQPSIKSLFLNDMDVIYDIDFGPQLVEDIREYSKDFREPVEQLIANNKQMVTELYDFDDGIVRVDVDLLENNYSHVLKQKPESVGEVMKHLILNSIIRSGQASLGNMLALYDSSKFLSVNSIIFSTLLTK